MDDVVSFLMTLESDRVNVGVFSLTFGPEDNDATLVSLSPVEYLCWGVGG